MGRKCCKFRKVNYDAINEHLRAIHTLFASLKSVYEVLSLTIDRADDQRIIDTVLASQDRRIERLRAV